jgi:hypothetical protein
VVKKIGMLSLGNLLSRGALGHALEVRVLDGTKNRSWFSWNCHPMPRSSASRRQ